MNLVTIRVAAKLLQLHPNTLRARETVDGRWCEVYDGVKIRVYRLSGERGAQRRYDEHEILRVLARLQRGR